jgi:DNA-binding MarR family transcriptional regulator
MRTAVRETSREVYQQMQELGRFGEQECKIMAFVRENCHLDFTRREISHYLDMETSTVSARVNALIKDGDIVERDSRRECSISKKNVHVIGLPLAQKTLF